MSRIDELQAKANELQASFIKEAVASQAEKLEFRSPRSRRDFVEFISLRIKPGITGGRYFGPEFQPLDEYLAAELSKRPWLLPETTRDTSPPAATEAAAPINQKHTVNIEDINPLMSDQQLRDAFAACREALHK